MARMRSLKPEFWSDLKITRVSRDARLLYLALWNQADEWARCHGDIRWIKGHCLPYDDDLNLSSIDALLNELAGINRIVRYSVGGDPFLYLPKLGKHQRLEPNKTPSRLPAPPADVAENFPDESEKSAERSEQIVVQHVAGSREHEAGSMEQGGKPRTRQHQVPDGFAPSEDMQLWAAANAPGVNIARSTAKFVNHYRASGATKINWEAQWRTWILNDYERLPKSTNGRASPTGYSTGEQRAMDAAAAAQQVMAARQQNHAQIGPA